MEEMICTSIVFLALIGAIYIAAVNSCSPKWCLINLIMPEPDNSKIPVIIAIFGNLAAIFFVTVVSYGFWSLAGLICKAIH